MPKLPARYQEPMKAPFLDALLEEMRPGITVLDVGSGRLPAIPVESRPDNRCVVGLDISRQELELAPAGSYDEMVVADITEHRSELVGRFDLIVSWQVLEHVKPLEAALDNIYAYLKPGGRFLAQFSGTFSAFGLINQVIPAPVGVWGMKTLLHRKPESVFPAYYHHCWQSKIAQAMTRWQSVKITPRYRAAGYWAFLPPLRSLYLGYENFATHHPNLATHYFIDARH